MPGNNVRDITKDRSEILWVATDNGIAKYDGSNFSTINKTNGLPSNRVWSIACDRNNTIYAGCYQGGLAVIKHDSIVRVIHTQGTFPDTYRRLFYSNYFKKLFVGTYDGLYVLNDTILVPINYPHDKTSQSIILSISAKDNLLFFTVLKGDAYGFYQLNFNNEQPEKSTTKMISRKGRFASIIFNDTVYVAEYNEILKFGSSDSQKTFEKSRVDTSYFIWNMTTYGKDKFLIGCLGDGRFKSDIFIYEPKKNNITSFEIKENPESVNSILHDSISGTTWFCRDNGLTAYKESPFKYFEPTIHDNIIDIETAGDTLLILTNKEILSYYQGKLNTLLTQKNVSRKIDIEWSKNNQKYGLTFRRLFDTSQGSEFAKFIKDGNKLFVNTAKGSVSIPDLRTYLPFGTGTFKFSEKTGAYVFLDYYPLRFYKSYQQPTQYEVISDSLGTINDISDIIRSNGVNYMPSSFNGLYAIDENKIYRLNESNSIIDNFLTDADKDSAGSVWCCSGNGNLFEIGFQDSLFIKRKLCLDSIGLVGNSCKWLKFNGNYLYIGTNKGLNVISKNNLASEHPAIEYFFNENNGYDFVSAINPVIGKDGKLYVHTLNQVISIDTTFSKSSKIKLDLFDLEINKHSADLRSLNTKSLPFRTKHIAFSFRVIKYPFSKNITYRYKINNEDFNFGNRITLESLRSGDYAIVMEGFDKEYMLTYSEKISFTINKPFWQTFWFLALIILVVGVIVYQIVKFRIKAIKARHEEKTRLIIQNSELQLRSLQLQMNPHFIFNALTSIQNFILTKNTEDSLIYLNNLASIIRTNLENATEEYILLSDEIEFLEKYISIEKLRFKDKLQLHLINNLTQPNLLIPPMLIQPLIENAIKHGVRQIVTQGIIIVELFNTNESMVVTVEDNGIGMKAAQKHKNEPHNEKGLNIIQNRLNLLNEVNHTTINSIVFEDLTFDGNPQGTKVIITLMLKQAL